MENIQSNIPENSETLMIDETTSRFSSAVWFEEMKKHTILLAGLGGIGSWSAILLSRLHPYNLVLYDDDIVEYGNISGQFYTLADCDLQKVYSISRHISKFSNYSNVFCKSARFTENNCPYDIMISGFDNMESRKTFFKVWLEGIRNKTDIAKRKCLYIDARMSAEYLQVFAIVGTDTRAIKEYASKWLFNSEEAEHTVCSYKQTSFISNMIASIITNIVVNHITNICPENVIPREVPFFTSYDASTMFLKIES